MALSTYTELKAAIADFLNRDDLASTIPTFIALAEAQINRDIRTMDMEGRASGQISGGDQYMQVPADWVETIRLHLTAAGTSRVSLMSRDAIAALRQKNDDTSDAATYAYAHAAGQFELYPTPAQDTDFELLYYKKVEALSDSNAANWLLSSAPDVYLYGALLHSAPYLAEDARIQVWAQLYSSAVQNVNTASDKARYSGSGLKMKVRGLG